LEHSTLYMKMLDGRELCFLGMATVKTIFFECL
jgi:hypothetical protein